MVRLILGCPQIMLFNIGPASTVRILPSWDLETHRVQKTQPDLQHNLEYEKKLEVKVSHKQTLSVLGPILGWEWYGWVCLCPVRLLLPREALPGLGGMVMRGRRDSFVRNTRTPLHVQHFVCFTSLQNRR